MKPEEKSLKATKVKGHSIIPREPYPGGKPLLWLTAGQPDEAVTGGVYLWKKERFDGTNGKTYQVFHDWSVREINHPNFCAGRW